MNICIICTDELASGNNVWSTMCGHVFHYSCLETWLGRNNTCPQCRESCPQRHRIYLVCSDNGASGGNNQVSNANSSVAEYLVDLSASLSDQSGGGEAEESAGEAALADLSQISLVSEVSQPISISSTESLGSPFSVSNILSPPSQFSSNSVPSSPLSPSPMVSENESSDRNSGAMDDDNMTSVENSEENEEESEGMAIPSTLEDESESMLNFYGFPEEESESMLNFSIPEEESESMLNFFGFSEEESETVLNFSAPEEESESSMANSFGSEECDDESNDDAQFGGISSESNEDDNDSF